jgi:hypothetical protein
VVGYESIKRIHVDTNNAQVLGVGYSLVLPRSDKSARSSNRAIKAEKIRRYLNADMKNKASKKAAQLSLQPCNEDMDIHQCYETRNTEKNISEYDTCTLGRYEQFQRALPTGSIHVLDIGCNAGRGNLTQHHRVFRRSLSNTRFFESQNFLFRKGDPLHWIKHTFAHFVWRVLNRYQENMKALWSKCPV